jgi:hypothetical protein
LVVTTYTIHLPQDSYLTKSEQGLNIGPTHSPGRREAAELSIEILDQFLEFVRLTVASSILSLLFDELKASCSNILNVLVTSTLILTERLSSIGNHY